MLNCSIASIARAHHHGQVPLEVDKKRSRGWKCLNKVGQEELILANRFDVPLLPINRQWSK
jgi:hypothetical protein